MLTGAPWYLCGVFPFTPSADRRCAEVVLVADQSITTPCQSPDHGAAFRPRVIFADDNAQFLDHAVQLMADECDILGTVSDGVAAVELVERLIPDIAVLDITMPIMDGLDVARRLRADGVQTKIIFLTVHDDPDYLREALDVGATGYVVKQRLVSDLPQAIQASLAGRRYVSATPNLQSIGSGENP